MEKKEVLISSPKTPLQRALTKTLFPDHDDKTVLVFNRSCVKKKASEQAPFKPLWKIERRSLLLDAAPEWNDPYLHSIDWGSDMFCSQEEKVLVYHLAADSVSEIYLNYPVQTIKSSLDRSSVAVGGTTGRISILDIETQKKKGSTSVSDPKGMGIFSVSWAPRSQGQEITFHSFDEIFHWDLRDRKNGWKCPSLPGGRVCSIGWDPDKEFLAVGRESRISIEDPRIMRERAYYAMTCEAAAKGIDWNQQGELVVGGGKKISIINPKQNQIICQKEGESPILDVRWIDSTYFLASTGSEAQGNLELWHLSPLSKTVSKIQSMASTQGLLWNIALKPDRSVLCANTSQDIVCFFDLQSNRQEIPLSRKRKRYEEYETVR
ncbi:MAG: WD40 repeat domain-containing protein [Chlamydiales bacterium]|nr:WD40 repeat domain-containing protein [Chlamydiales bacterium]